MKSEWLERINMLSVNPDAATRDDVARLASDVQHFWLWMKHTHCADPDCDCELCVKINAAMEFIFKDSP